MTPKTKLEIECELLKLDHDVRSARNNENAFRFKASMATGARENQRRARAAQRQRGVGITRAVGTRRSSAAISHSLNAGPL